MDTTEKDDRSCFVIESNFVLLLLQTGVQGDYTRRSQRKTLGNKLEMDIYLKICLLNK